MDGGRTMRARVAVIGTGTIGTGWAAFYAAKGLRVALFDEEPGAARAAAAKVESILGILAGHDLLSGGVDEAVQHVRVCETLAQAVEGADFVQEAVYESYDAKKAVFAALDELTPPDVLLASSSSGLLMSEIQQAAARHPERCLIAHPINPVYLIPLVELVPGRQTSPQVIQDARAFYERLGKVPVMLRREVPGNLENRMTAALYREAVDLVQQGVASVEDVDRAIWAGPGLRYAFMGPLLIYHLGGGAGGVRQFVEHFGPALQTWWQDLRTWTELHPGAVAKLEAGLQEATGGRTLDEITMWRDERLIGLLKLLAHHGNAEEA